MTQPQVPAGMKVASMSDHLFINMIETTLKVAVQYAISYCIYSNNTAIIEYGGVRLPIDRTIKVDQVLTYYSTHHSNTIHKLTLKEPFTSIGFRPSIT